MEYDELVELEGGFAVFRILKDEKGITFVEFVTVMLILIILAGIVGAKYISIASDATRSKCVQNQSALNAAAALAWANSALTGSPSYPTSISDLAPLVTRHYTDQCANDDGTDLVYDNTTGRISCPNHP